jgi:hypothetical protein
MSNADTFPRCRDAKRARIMGNKTLNNKRAQETPDAQPHPQPRVQNEKHTSKSPQASRTTRRFLRNGFTDSFVLAPETGLYCLRRRRNARALSPT